MSSVWNPQNGITSYAIPSNATTVDTVAGLLLTPGSLFKTVITRGYYAAGDGGGGVYTAVLGQTVNGVTILAGADGTIWALQYSLSIDVRQVGCIHNTDSTTQLQAAENWLTANGGGELVIPPAFILSAKAIIFKPGVSYRGAGGLPSKSNFSGCSVMQVAAGGEIFGYTAARCSGKRFTNLVVRGNGAVAGNLRGFWCGKQASLGLGLNPFAQYAALPDNTAERWIFENVMFDGFLQESLFEEWAVGTRMENCLAINGLMDLTYLTAQRANITCYTNDGRYTDCEFASRPNSNGGKVTSTNLYAAAFWLAGGAARAKSFVSATVCELSDIGFIAGQIGLKTSNIRCDLNNGHGMIVTATNGEYQGQCYDNSLDTDNLYDGVVVTAGGGGSVFTGFRSDCSSSQPNRVRYAFHDQVSSSVNVYNRSQFMNCHGTGWRSAEFWTDNPLSSGPFFNMAGAEVFLTTNLATPSVDGVTDAATNNTSATGYTNFVVTSNEEQFIRIRVTDGNTTFVNGTNLKTNTGANVAGVIGAVYEFRYRNGIWYQWA